MGPRWSVRSISFSISLLTLVGAGAVVAAGEVVRGSPRISSRWQPDHLEEGLADDLPLYFIENRGQADPRVEYYVQGAENSLYFTPQGLTLSLGGNNERWVLQQRFLGAGTTKPEAEGITPAVVSYFKGSPSEWETAIPTYSTVAYRDLWPGIDLVYSGTGSGLKYDLMVRPGADPSTIQMAYRGATDLGVNTQGQLRVSTGEGGFLEDTPYAYQDVGGRRTEVPASFDIGPGRSYGFDLGSFDRTRPLVIDPAMFVYAGYIGGLSSDRGQGVAVDTAGSAYVAGTTRSNQATFPVVVGPDTTHNGGAGDAFVAKVNPAGTGLLYAGYIGGSGGERGLGIAVDASGSAYVTGETTSTEATFPATGGPDTTHNGGLDAFVAKVDAAGTGLLYAGYIGGSGVDQGYGIAVDDMGNAYVTGDTQSTEASFPVIGGPDTTYNGMIDAFVAKVDPTGAALIYAGYIGGDEDEEGFGIGVDPTGSASITGYTDAGSADTFPVTVGPDTTNNLGGTDAFVAKVNPAGTGLVYAGYIGGGQGDRGFGIAADASGNAYVTGFTGSPQTSFPDGDGFGAVPGPDQTYNGGAGGGRDAFVAKVNPAGTGLLYAGYIGGSLTPGVANGNEQGFGIAVDAAGAAYVAGDTFSTEDTFPDGDGFGTVTGPDTTWNGGFDAFVVKVNPAGAGLDYAGYIGGSGFDFGLGIAVDASESAYVTGHTVSTEAQGFPVLVGPDTTHNGDEDAFVVKIGEAEPPAGADMSLDKTDSPDPVQVKKFLTYTLSVTNGGPDDASMVTAEDELPSTVVFVSAAPSQGTCVHSAGVVTCDLGSVSNGGSATVTIKVRPTQKGSITNSAEVSAAEADPNPGNNSDSETTTVVRCRPTC